MIKSTRRPRKQPFSFTFKMKFSHFISAHKLCFNSKIVHFIIFVEPHFLSVLFRKPQNMSKSKINSRLRTSRSSPSLSCPPAAVAAVAAAIAVSPLLVKVVYLVRLLLSNKQKSEAKLSHYQPFKMKPISFIMQFQCVKSGVRLSQHHTTYLSSGCNERHTMLRLAKCKQLASPLLIKKISLRKYAFRHFDAVTQSMCQFKMNGSAINLPWLENVRNAEFCAVQNPCSRWRKCLRRI